METGFSVMKNGNVWTLRMKGSCTEAKFGTLRGCMQCAYHLTDAHFSDDPANWAPAGDAQIDGGV